jgi:hydrogenase expression/formation protein HypC
MCLGIPGEVVAVRDDAGLRFAKVRFAGVSRDVCLECVPDAQVGDYVLVHVGFAIARLDRDEAERTYRILEELGQAEELAADGAAPAAVEERAS